MLNALWIFTGGGLGSLARWWFSGVVASTVGQTFPWGTLAVNVTGSFVIGLFATATGPGGRWLAPTSFREFFMVGICGGYTTFSSFSLQTLSLAQEASGCMPELTSFFLFFLVWWPFGSAIFWPS